MKKSECGLAVICLMATLYSGCSDSNHSRNGAGILPQAPLQNPNGGGNPPGPAPATKMVDFRLAGNPLTPKKGESFNFGVIAMFSDNGERIANESKETNYSVPDTSFVQSLDVNTGVGVATDQKIGATDLVVIVNIDGVSLTKTFTGALQVVDGTVTPPPPPPPFPNSDKLSAISIVMSSTPTKGVAARLDAEMTDINGVKDTTKRHLLFWTVSDYTKGTIDASTGQLYMLNGNEALTLNAWGIGDIPANLIDPQENWLEVMKSNDLIVTSSTLTPPAGSLIILLDGSTTVSTLGRRTITVIDMDNGQDVTDSVVTAGGLAISDTTKAQIVNDNTGVARVIEGQSAGFWSLTVTYNTRTFTLGCRTLNGNPWISRYTDASSVVHYVWDNYVRFARPYKDAGGTWKLPILCSLDSSIIQDIANPGWFGAPDWDNNPLPPMIQYSDAKTTPTMWGSHVYDYTGDTGTYNMPSFQYVGKWENPIVEVEMSDPALWSFPSNIKYSAWYDNYTTPAPGDGLMFTLNRDVDPEKVAIVQLDQT